MDILTTVSALRDWRRARAGVVALVPTMGNLHAGHLRLVREARERADHALASIFVNRLQFGPNEDFDRYPRTLEADCEQLQAAGCDAVFCPSESTMYPVPQTVVVEPPPRLAEPLCGAFRPGHFRGVCTVVLKLFNLTRPELAVFGLKDYQQFVVIRRMVEELNLGVEMVGVDTVREADGLAMSSRNRYLSEAARQEAPYLAGLLKACALRATQGEDLSALEREGFNALSARGWRVDYFSFANLDKPEQAPNRLFAAARLEHTRLIDNWPVQTS